jgi:HK97 family phage major capsid protein
MKVTTGLRRWAVENGTSPGASDAEISKQATKAMAGGTLSGDRYIELMGQDDPADFSASVKAAVREQLDDRLGQQRKTPSAAAIITGNVRVKSESEKYNSGSRFIRHKSGIFPTIDSKPVELPSDRTRAKAGAWFKQWVRRQAAGGDLPPLSEHERGLVREMSHEGLWAGPDGASPDGWGAPRKLFDYEVKALIGDSGTGGAFLYPVELDTIFLSTPLLTGELYPFVDQRTAKHAAITTPLIGTPTVLWNNSPDAGTATLFSATSLIAQLSTTFTPVSCFIEIGLDLIRDSAIDVAATLEQLIGQAMLAELDRVIAVGSGSGEPLGLFNSVGATIVPSANNGDGPLTVGDAERLYFSLSKPMRAEAYRPAFCSSDTTYRRFRSIPAGQDDERRIFGMDHASYTMMDRPYRVGPAIADNKAAFVALARYIMYRRQGFETRFTDQGATLFKSNTAILAVRGRFGGSCDPSAVAIMPNCPLSE